MSHSPLPPPHTIDLSHSRLGLWASLGTKLPFRGSPKNQPLHRVSLLPHRGSRLRSQFLVYLPQKEQSGTSLSLEEAPTPTSASRILSPKEVIT